MEEDWRFQEQWEIISLNWKKQVLSQILSLQMVCKQKKHLSAEKLIFPNFFFFFAKPVIELSNKTRNLIVLASDGLWDVMNGEEALTQIEPLESASDMSHKLVTTALENPKCQDNITVISAAL